MTVMTLEYIIYIRACFVPSNYFSDLDLSFYSGDTHQLTYSSLPKKINFLKSKSFLIDIS